MRDRHAGECERHQLLLDLAAADAAVAAEGEVAAPLIAVAGRRQRQHHQAVHARVVPGVHQARQVGADALDPHRIGVVDQERPGAQPRQRLAHAAARVEPRRPLVGDLDDGRTAALQVLLDLIGHVMHVDDARFTPAAASRSST